jgi:predicted phage-related endonuclease
MASKWGEDGTEEVPDAYLLQCAWYMALTDFSAWDLAVKIDSADYHEYTIMRNKNLESRIIEIGEDFWFNCVVAGVPPKPDGSESYAKYIQSAYPKDSGEMIVVSDSDPIRKTVEELGETLAMLQHLEERSEELKSVIKAAIGEKSGLDGGDWKITWKKTKDSTKVDYCKALNILAQKYSISSEEVHGAVAEATEIKEGTRRFLPKFDLKNKKEAA